MFRTFVASRKSKVLIKDMCVCMRVVFNCEWTYLLDLAAIWALLLNTWKTLLMIFFSRFSDNFKCLNTNFGFDFVCAKTKYCNSNVFDGYNIVSFLLLS